MQRLPSPMAAPSSAESPHATRVTLHTPRKPFPHLWLLIFLAFGMLVWASSDGYSAPAEEKTPITVEDMEAEWAAATREKRPFKIENRIIEGRKAEGDTGRMAPLDYLNSRFAEEGSGITLINCAIKGDLNFVRHARPASEVKDLLPKGTLQSLLNRARFYIIPILETREIRVAVIGQKIEVTKCTVDGSIIAYARESPVPDAYTVFLNTIRFNGMYSKEAFLGSATFSGDGDSRSTTFSGNANFWSATFSGNADFSGATFSGNANFRSAAFSGNADFSGATLSGNANFRSATFSGNANFRSARFSGNADFSEATFSGNANLGSVNFNGEARFWWVNFSGEAGFGSVNFSGNANFRSVNFGGNASFDQATFVKEAGFDSVNFSGNASFGSVNFVGEAHFRSASFGREASFHQATFVEEAGFGSVNFVGEAHFRSASFGREANFCGAFFTAGLDAARTRFIKQARFWGAMFQGEVDFGGAEFQGPADFVKARFAAGKKRVKTPVNFDLCTFKAEADFANARFQEPVIFSASIIEDQLRFDNVRFEDDLNLSGVLLKKGGTLCFVGARCEDIFFGVSKPIISWNMKEGPNVTAAVKRAVRYEGRPLHEQLCPGSSIDFTGAFYSRLLFLEWSKLGPAVEQGLINMGLNAPGSEAKKAQVDPKGKDSLEDSAGNPTERINAAIAALRLLAKNYAAVGSKADALESYRFYREKRMEFQGTPLDTFIWLTTGFGARNERLLYCFLGLWLIPWALGYWRPGVIVAAEKGTAPPDETLWNWVGTLGGDESQRKRRMIAYSLWFSFNVFVPAIEVFGFKQWVPSNDKIHFEKPQPWCLPIRYYSLATFQRIMGWILIPIAIAALSGLFGVK